VFLYAQAKILANPALSGKISVADVEADIKRISNLSLKVLGFKSFNEVKHTCPMCAICCSLVFSNLLVQLTLQPKQYLRATALQVQRLARASSVQDEEVLAIYVYYNSQPLSVKEVCGRMSPTCMSHAIFVAIFTLCNNDSGFDS
jgi:hypothetical protein